MWQPWFSYGRLILAAIAEKLLINGQDTENIGWDLHIIGILTLGSIQPGFIDMELTVLFLDHRLIMIVYPLVLLFQADALLIFINIIIYIYKKVKFLLAIRSNIHFGRWNHQNFLLTSIDLKWWRSRPTWMFVYWTARTAFIHRIITRWTILVVGIVA